VNFNSKLPIVYLIICHCQLFLLLLQMFMLANKNSVDSKRSHELNQEDIEIDINKRRAMTEIRQYPSHLSHVCKAIKLSRFGGQGRGYVNVLTPMRTWP